MTYPSSLTRAAVRRRVEQAMGSIILISRGTLGELDPVTLLVGGITAANTIYDGPARIRTVNGADTVSLGGGEIAVRNTIISIPMSVTAVPRRDDLVQVISDSGSDADLDSRVFRVLDVDGGGFFGDARRLGCAGWYQSRWWKA